jgi:hypothetical protein
MQHFAVESSKSERGSITVESSIIVPFIILCIASVIYMGMILHQRALIQSAAEMAAQAGAAAWAKGLCPIGIGKPDKESLEKIKLYRRIYDSEKTERLKQIEVYALELATKSQLIQPDDLVVKAAIKDYALLRRMEVEITKHIRLPLGKYMRMFGGSGRVEMTVKATASIDEPSELIRNTDFILDIEKELENKFPQLKNVGDKARDFLSQISNKLEEFIN